MAASARAALVDATSARYVEILALGGLAFSLRSSLAPFALALLVLLGVLLLGYANAKAEGFGVKESGGDGRSVLLIGLVLACAPVLGFAHGTAPLRAAALLLPAGVGANAAAVWRLRHIAARLHPSTPPKPPIKRRARHPLVARFLAALGSGLSRFYGAF